MNVVKIILFGSLNENNVGKCSDIDIAIIKNTKKTFSKRLEEVYQKIQPRVAVDFFVYTPDELNDLKKSSYFLRKILARGKILYEA